MKPSSLDALIPPIEHVRPVERPGGGDIDALRARRGAAAPARRHIEIGWPAVRRQGEDRRRRDAGADAIIGAARQGAAAGGVIDRIERGDPPCSQGLFPEGGV